MQALSPRLTAYLQSWFDTSTKDKRSKGITVTLTYEQFVGLFHTRQIKTLEAAIADNRLRYLQDRDNPFAFVLTWRGYEHCQTDVFSADTACICSRQKSKMINSIQVGTRLSARTRAKIGAAKRGKPLDQEHKDALSASLTGKPKTPWTEERKAARKAQLAAKKAGGAA